MIDGEQDVYEVAQWYPRMAVFDDVRGWNTDRTSGRASSTWSTADFDVSITVPADILVAATGVLQNPAQVLTAGQRARLARAAQSDVRRVIRGRARSPIPPLGHRRAPGVLTWRFRAEGVRDFAWAAGARSSGTRRAVNGGRR